ncbi:hypothetical protein NFJ02_17g27630 [Pycnococcus provasolii]
MAMRVVMAPSLFASVVSSSSLRRLSSLSLQDTSFTLGGCRSADSSNKEDAGSAHAKGEEEELVPWFDALVSAGTLRACEPQRRALTSLTSLREDVLRHANSLKQYKEQKESHAKKRLEILEKLEQEARRKQEQLEQQQAHTPDTSSSNQQKWFATMPFAFALARRRERTEQQVLEQSKKAAKERAAEADRIVGPPPARPTPPLGLYLHGDVGAGKSLALDMFAAKLTKVHSDDKTTSFSCSYAGNQPSSSRESHGGGGGGGFLRRRAGRPGLRSQGCQVGDPCTPPAQDAGGQATRIVGRR